MNLIRLYEFSRSTPSEIGVDVRRARFHAVCAYKKKGRTGERAGLKLGERIFFSSLVARRRRARRGAALTELRRVDTAGFLSHRRNEITYRPRSADARGGVTDIPWSRGETRVIDV